MRLSSSWSENVASDQEGDVCYKWSNKTMKLTDSATNAKCEFKLSTAESVAYL